MKEVLVTTSWDDGHVLDTRLAKLLKKYGVKATFYISPREREFNRSDLLTNEAIQALGRSFEIGAHTMTHPRLPKVTDEVARREIVSSKRYLEKLTGKPILSFCYPGGSYRKRHVAMVRKAGFTYARTVRRHAYGFEGFPFEAETTVNTYNHYQDLWKIAKFARFRPSKMRFYFQWDNLAKAMFDRILEHGGVFHLWGHSWEVDGHGDWEKLESVLQYISGKPEARYVTNGELAEIYPKRLLMVAPYFPPHLGGQEFYSYNIASILQKNFGWRVWVVTSGRRGFWRPRQTTYKGIDLYQLPYWFKLSNTPINPLWFFTLKRIAKKEAITILNAHAPVPFFADIAVRATKPIPSVVTYHYTTLQKGPSSLNRFLRFYEQRLLRKTFTTAAKVVGSSAAVTDGFLKPYGLDTTTITPGVDTGFFTPPAKNERGSDTILYVGSLDKSHVYKGVRFLLEAFALVSQHHHQAELVLVGEGTGHESFKKLAQKLGVASKVKFAGGKFGQNLVRQYQDASMLVLPSLSESFGIVIVEAMACGLPVVASNVGGIPSIVQDGQTGYLVPPADSQALAEKIDYLLSHPATAKRLGEGGLQRVGSGFTWHRSAQLTNQILLESLGDVAESVT